MIDRRLLAFFATVAVFVGAAGYTLAQQRSNDAEVIAATPVTLLPPRASTTTTTAPPATGTVRSTLPPTPSSEVFIYAADGGCTPGTNQLDDGIYHGSLVITGEDRLMEFNLKCLFRAEDLPENFSELFADRFPGQVFPATGVDLVDPAAIDRTVRYTRLSEFVIDGGLYIGDEAASYYEIRGSTPFDATILIEEGAVLRVDEIVGPEVNPG